MNDLKIIESREILGKDFKIYGDFDNPLFLAKDVANWIEHNKPSEMVSNVDENEKLKAIISLSGQKREVIMLTEDGLYEVLMLSRKPIAKEFKKKVKEILKEIRKNGGYIYSNENDSDEDIMARALIIAQKTIERKNEKINQLEDKVKEQIPKVDYYDKVTNNKKSIGMGDVAKLIRFKNLVGKDIGRNCLFKILRENKILNEYNIPYQKYINLGYFEIKQSLNKYSGEPIYTTLVTSKGIEYIINLLKKLGYVEITY